MTTSSSIVSSASDTEPERSFKGFATSCPNPITATTNTKTSLAMISAALNVESRAAEAIKRGEGNSSHSMPLGVVGDTSGVMRQRAPVAVVDHDELHESTALPHSWTASRLLQSSIGHHNAMVVSIVDAAGDQCSTVSSPVVSQRLRSSSAARSSQVGDPVDMSSAQRLPADGAYAPPSLAVEPGRLASTAVNLRRGSSSSSSSTTSAVDSSSALAAVAANLLHGVTQGPTGELKSDKKQRILQTGGSAPGMTRVANITATASANATVLLRDASVETPAKHLAVPLRTLNSFDVSSSSSVGGHHLSITEGSAFLKQSGSRREESFYNVIRPYQETLVREAVRQAPHTVEHWNRRHAGVPCRGVQKVLAATLSSSSTANRVLHSPLHTSPSFQLSGESEDVEGVVANPDDVAAMCEARWEAYQLYEAHDMSNLHILASEQLTDDDAGCEPPRGGGGGDGAGRPSRDRFSSPTSLHQVDKSLVELAARLWWTVRFRNFYRTSSAAYEVQRQAAEAAGLSPPPLPLVSSSSIERENAEHTGEAAVGGSPAVALLASTTSGTATPCMVGSFVDSLSEGLASGASAAERRYVLQKHRALQLLAAFVPRYHGTRRLPLRDVLRYEREGRATATAAASTTAAAKDGVDPLKVPEEGHGATTASSAAAAKGEAQHRMVDADDDDDNKGDGKICRMIMLEYVCYRFRHPCVMDIKMGSRQYGLHPAAEKKRSKVLKANLSTSARYGIRLAGYRRWDPEEKQYRFRSKLQCRFLTLEEVKSEMSDFLHHSREIEHVFRRQLQRLRVAFSQQTVFRFYTSSLLFVYDAEDPLRTARVTMVDFAYTYESKELLQGGDPDAEFDYDIGYLKAIDTLLSLLA
ncbi:hypothetical protein JKF63_06680 [Porcisia hertigi]|uniref:Kinase n=1 Tax=Porcisia hertigi TaxID=2761500 RepID=A0A836IPD9_9TRYP|nr:hypothetical protein JKF63_06680 [Porcisia hertigi]